MTYNYQPTSLTPRKINQEASSLLEALQNLRARKDSATGDSVQEDTERSEREEPEEGDPDEEAPRPIIFLAQDVGGLIVKAVGSLSNHDTLPPRPSANTDLLGGIGLD